MAFTMLPRRGAVYYFRKVIPSELRLILGRYAYMVSLKTTDLETAKARKALEEVKVNQMIARARLTLQNHPDIAVEKIARTLAKQTRDQQGSLGVRHHGRA